MPTLYVPGRVSRVLLHVSQLYLYTIAANILLSELIFVVGGTVTWYTVPLSFLVGMMSLITFYGSKPGKGVFYEIVAAVTLFLFLTELCGRIYDLTWDGNSYHKMAIGLLKNDWNPLYLRPNDALKRGMGFDAPTIYVESYAKGPWILAAGVYSMTGNIECGKVYTLIGMICAFCLTYYCMRKREKSTFFAVALSLVGALNPVAVAQATSFYVDGYLHVMLYILVLSLAMLDSNGMDKESKLQFVSIVTCAMIICGTAKFTGLLYGGVYCVVFFIHYCYKQLNSNEIHKNANIRLCFWGFAGLAAVTVLWAGADTYVINIVRHGSPFYPLYGKDAVDIMTNNSPFNDVNHIKNLFISLFSKVSNNSIASGQTPEWKMPFTLDWAYESTALEYADARISGFGVLFSGIFLIAVLSVLKEFVRQKHGKELRIPFWVWLILTNVGLCLAITESWWARYAPYIYFTALIGIFFFLSTPCLKSVKLGNFLKITVFVCFLCNNLLFLKGIGYKLKLSKSIRSEICSLRSYHEVEVSNINFPGIYFNFEDQHIRYIPNNSLTETEDVETFLYMDLKVLPK